MSFEEATTLPVALQTMHDALMTNGRLKKGESVSSRAPAQASD